MFRTRIPWVILTGAWLCADSPGGIYDPGSRDASLAALRRGQELPFELFRLALDDSSQAADARFPDRPSRKTLLDRRRALRDQGLNRLSAGPLTELGVIHLRLREVNAALEVLKRAETQNPRDFWALTSLASAYQANCQPGEAVRYLEIAQDFPPPAAWADAFGYSPTWIKTVERAQLKLLRLRLREAGSRPEGRQGPPPNVDELFPARFVAPGVAYEAGKIADAEKAKLPADAIAVVQQLLLWMPEDTRLYWLLGELYNARGDLEAADVIFDACVGSRGFGSPALREHRRLVKEALAAQAPPAPPTHDWKPTEGKLLVVGVASGLILFALAYFQVRQLVRRRSSVPRSARG
jgi:tetratricopeptide (TPR) repeat protein